MLWEADTLLERPQRCLRARAILIRPASERPSIVLALTLASVYHWLLSGGLLGGGGGDSGDRGEGGVGGALSSCN